MPTIFALSLIIGIPHNLYRGRIGCAAFELEGGAAGPALQSQSKMSSRLSLITGDEQD